MRWRGVIAVEGRVSVDGRLVDPGTLSWETPIPLCAKNPEPSFDYRIVGSVEKITRDGHLIRGEGEVYSDLPEGRDLSGSAGMGLGEILEREVDGEDVMVFTGAVLHAVFVGAANIWPECVLEVEDD